MSDTHFDFYFNSASTINERKVRGKFDEYFKNLSSEYLIIAGDIGHYPRQNLGILKLIKKIYGFKEIISVQGNHDLWRISKAQRNQFNNGLDKVKFQMDLFNDNGIHALDGNIIDIEGIKVGGCNSWYDGAIYYNQVTGWYNSSGGIESYWKSYMNDSKMMNIDEFHSIFKAEKDKLLNIKGKCDIIITHVKPLIETIYQLDEFKGELSNCFYTFDYSEHIVDDSRLKAWVFGHTHDKQEWVVGDKKLYCNPYGYPSEKNNSKVEHIWIE